MKNFRISLDAARIIALTAMLGFVDDRYKIDAESIFRSRIALVTTPAQVASESGAIPPDRTAYLFELKRGDSSKAVLVDAYTGQILSSGSMQQV